MMLKTKITSLVLAFMFAISVSPNTVAMEMIASDEDTGITIRGSPQDVMILVLSFVAVGGRIAMLTVSRQFSELIQKLWSDGAYRHYGFYTDRPIFQSRDTNYICHPLVVSGEDIYLLRSLYTGSSQMELAVMQLRQKTIPELMNQLTLSQPQLQRLSVADSFIFITEQNLNFNTGALRIIQRGENHHHALTQTIAFDPANGQCLCPLSRGEYLYVACRVDGVPNNLLKIYRRDEGNQYVFADEIDVDFQWTQEIIRLDDNDILLAGKFGRLIVVRLGEDKQHNIVQKIELSVSNLCNAPVLDCNLIYLSYEKGRDDKLADFYVIHRDEKGVLQSWEEFEIGEPTAPVIMGNQIVVASRLTGRVFVFKRDEEGHHHLIQVIGLKGAKPNNLVAHGNALYVSNERSDTIFILYRQLDERFLHMGEFQNPGKSAGHHYGCRPVLHGDVLLLAGGFKFVTLTYPKPRDGKDGK